MPLQIPLPTDDPHADIAQYVPLLISSIEGFLQARDVWDPADYPQAYSYMEDLKAYLVETLPPVNNAFLKYATHFHINSKVTHGNALALTVNTALMFNHEARQNPSAIFDAFEFEIPLKAGSYTIDICYMKASGSGIMDFGIVGYSSTSIDMYAGGTTNNVVTSLNFPVTEDRLQKFTAGINSKNAASAGYTARIIYFAIHSQ
jgi:hypothetical protein